MIIETLKKLDYKRLKEASDTGHVGCPFHRDYRGPKEGPPFPSAIYSEQRKLCFELCGELFSAVKDCQMCPCFYYGPWTLEGPDYVKATFWKALNKALGR